MDGLEWKRSKWPWYAKMYLKINERAAVMFSDRVIADAENIKLYLNAAYGSDFNCTVIPYGAPIPPASPDPGALRAFSLSPGNYSIIVCRLEPENNVQQIIEGYLCSASRRPLVIVGNYRVTSKYVRRLLEYQQEGRLRFVGPVYEKDSLQALRYYAFAYFHGHSVGGTNPSLLEAMGCGNIVIAHDNVFNREVAADVAWYFRSAEDIPDIVNAIEGLPLHARQERKAAAIERVRKFYDWDQITTKYELLLKEAMSK
jgi:glycosyltransferase involved in cell wall biosynthesis